MSLGIWLKGRGKFGKGQETADDIHKANAEDIFLLKSIQRTDQLENTGEKGTGTYLEKSVFSQTDTILFSNGIDHVVNYDFVGQIAGFVIGGGTYYSPITPFTLDPSHATENRIDVIALTYENGVGKMITIKGDNFVGLAVKPELPDYNTMLELTFIPVDANTTEPTITNLVIYDENIEFTTTDNTGGVRVNFADNSNPFINSLNIRGTGFAHGDEMLFDNGSEFNVYDYSRLQLQGARADGKWHSDGTIQVAYFNGATRVSSWIKIHSTSTNPENSPYYIDTKVDGYQMVSIPVSEFVFTSNTATAIKMTKLDFKNPVDFYLDLIRFQTGIPDPPDLITITNTSELINDGEFGTGKYVEVAPTGLEYIDEQGGGKGGWRLIGRDGQYYGVLGWEAVDFSESQTVSNTLGATGDGSLCFGYENTTGGYTSFSTGYYNTSAADATAANTLGVYNNSSNPFATCIGMNNTCGSYVGACIGTALHTDGSTSYVAVGQANTVVVTPNFPNTGTDRVFVVGNGTITTPAGAWEAIVRSDALVILKNGTVRADSLTIALIDADPTGKMLVTKEYLSTGSGGGNLQKEISTTYTMATGDDRYTIFLNGTFTITVDLGLGDNFECDFINVGAGNITFAQGTVTTWNAPDGLVLYPNKVCALIKRLSNEDVWLKGELI